MSKSYVPAWLRERVAVQARHRFDYCLTAETVSGPAGHRHFIPEARVDRGLRKSALVGVSPVQFVQRPPLAGLGPVAIVTLLFNLADGRSGQTTSVEAAGDEIIDDTHRPGDRRGRWPNLPPWPSAGGAGRRLGWHPPPP
jgi:hypothetical protein